MSDAMRTAPFDPKDEQPIPVWPLPDPPPSKEERVYVIGMHAVNGQMQYYFTERPPIPDPSNDGPLEIRVPKDTTIVLRLDSTWNWEFRHENAVVLGPMGYKDHPRYFNLTQTIADGRCLEVRFNALFLDIGDLANYDPYALYINVNQELPDKSGTASLLVRIDPDIDNPGGRPNPQP